MSLLNKEIQLVLQKLDQPLRGSVSANDTEDHGYNLDAEQVSHSTLQVIGDLQSEKGFLSAT